MTSQQIGNVGGGVRRLRRSRGLPLRVVAEQVGVSESFISQVERGATNPSIATLQRIAQVFGASVTDFFDGTENRQQVVRGADAPRMTRPQRGQEDVLLTPYGVHGFELMLSTVGPGEGSGEELYAHAGDEECVYVVEGCITIRTEDRVFDLEQGDVALLTPRRPHGFFNPGDRVTKLLWVTSPPGVRPI